MAIQKLWERIICFGSMSGEAKQTLSRHQPNISIVYNVLGSCPVRSTESGPRQKSWVGTRIL